MLGVYTCEVISAIGDCGKNCKKSDVIGCWNMFHWHASRNLFVGYISYWHGIASSWELQSQHFELCSIFLVLTCVYVHGFSDPCYFLKAQQLGILSTNIETRVDHEVWLFPNSSHNTKHMEWDHPYNFCNDLHRLELGRVNSLPSRSLTWLIVRWLSSTIVRKNMSCIKVRLF